MPGQWILVVVVPWLHRVIIQIKDIKQERQVPVVPAAIAVPAP